MKDVLRRARNIIAQTMADHLAPLFKPDMRLTFIARSISDPDCYMILTDEADADLSKVAESIRRHSESEAALAARREARQQTIDLEKKLAAEDGFTYHEATE